MTGIHYLRLECVTNNHNKFYEIFTVKDNDKFIVYTAHGRIGHAPSVRLLISANGQHVADNACSKLALEKIKVKKYKITQELIGEGAQDKINTSFLGQIQINLQYQKEKEKVEEQDKASNRFFGLDN